MLASNLSIVVLQLKLNVPLRGLVNSSRGSKNSCRGPQNRSRGHNLPNLEEPGRGPGGPRLTLTTDDNLIITISQQKVTAVIFLISDTI